MIKTIILIYLLIGLVITALMEYAMTNGIAPKTVKESETGMDWLSRIILVLLWLPILICMFVTGGDVPEDF